MGSIGSPSTSSQSSVTEDNRISTGQGNILAATKNTIDGGTFNIVSADPEVAKTAINAATGLAGQTLTAASQLTNASNSIAAQVAASQQEFVATASGQKSVTYIVAGVAVVGIIGAILLRKNA